jgi:reactive chlorine resistance protein C
MHFIEQMQSRNRVPNMPKGQAPEDPSNNLNWKSKMSTRANQFRLRIAEKSVGSLSSLALLRWALVVVFLWFGAMKFTAYEANGIAPFIINSPIMSWLHSLFGVQGASYVIGVIELSTAAALIIGAFQPVFSALGAAMSTATYLITLTFFLSTPGVAEATAGGFPAISALPGQFLLKDVALLAASLSLLLASIEGSWPNGQKS